MPVLVLSVLTGTLLYGAELSIVQMAPSLKQLGTGWTSNSVVVYVDQVSPTKEICNEGKGWLQAARNVVDPRLGEEVRFYQRHGMHNNIAFRRGAYLVDVEGSNAEIEELKTLAELVDNNLLKAQKDHGR